MLRQISILIEIMAVFVCIHRLYGKRVKANIETALAYLGCMAIYSVIDRYEFRTLLSLTAYLIIGIYCIRSQKDSVKGAMLSISLSVIIIAIMQFIYMLPLNVLLGNKTERTFGVNLLVLVSFIWIAPKTKMFLLRKAAEKYNSFAILMLGIGIYIGLLLLLRESLDGKLFLLMFAFSIPITAFSFLAIEKWNKVQSEKKNLQDELQATRIPKDKYKELLKTTRIQYHGLMNQVVAISAIQYAYKSHDKLIKTQNEYCGKILQENRYYKLLLIENEILAGFLYGKIQAIESESINIEYEIKGTFQQSVIPIHHLIEMLGILLDNAMQAIENNGINERRILFGLLEQEQYYQFKISNKFPYTRYDEIETWFQLGKSTKGKEHGIGLYRMRCLCDEHHCNIICRNIEIKEENWIEFALEVHKADRE